MAIEPLFPRWARSIGALIGSNALARSQCCACGIQQRVDLEAMAAKFGGTASLIGRVDRCSIVACSGSVFYMAARTYGRAWIMLGQASECEERAPARDARALVPLAQAGADRSR
ncbi:hypothetical protein ACQKOH_21255 [Sphingomonas sp. NPDC092331]|jgi:hypothetical protein|uniref:Uncharacterized protein n=5 Tax=Sphingomonadaceae TaxID=41297 RepID=A0A401J8M4_SPHXE|nr:MULTISPECIES: hypothetical protein [Sphingomonadaceae]MBN8841659.1 hypothetical protein [Sphingomonadales bacterium]MEC7931665.1 hypothetical protein [Pseudomonadota bacterium]PZU71679.1 MAG: hypothetical protein DI546_15280 [Rhizobium sp.]ALR23042.1 hypothetical protein ATN00_21320 [Sphingobium baderi]EQB16055.1 hypothetical protein L284_10095 [Novosphingobium lindaniclasticum LE124]